MANAGYIIAAYGITAIVVVGYTLMLWRRMARARAELELGEGGDRGSA